jgi:hypothetical protein
MIEKYPAMLEIAKAVSNKITANIILFQILDYFAVQFML